MHRLELNIIAHHKVAMAWPEIYNAARPTTVLLSRLCPCLHFILFSVSRCRLIRLFAYSLNHHPRHWSSLLLLSPINYGLHTLSQVLLLPISEICMSALFSTPLQWTYRETHSRECSYVFWANLSIYARCLINLDYKTGPYYLGYALGIDHRGVRLGTGHATEWVSVDGRWCKASKFRSQGSTPYNAMIKSH